jgi:hypothetical protein
MLASLTGNERTQLAGLLAKLLAAFEADDRRPPDPRGE